VQEAAAAAQLARCSLHSTPQIVGGFHYGIMFWTWLSAPSHWVLENLRVHDTGSSCLKLGPQFGGVQNVTIRNSERRPCYCWRLRPASCAAAYKNSTGPFSAACLNLNKATCHSRRDLQLRHAGAHLRPWHRGRGRQLSADPGEPYCWQLRAGATLMLCCCCQLHPGS
jgi:hypothetical protein